MSDGLSFTEIDAQRVELLPARTVLSLTGTVKTGGGFQCGGNGGVGGNGGSATGGIGVNALNIILQHDQYNLAGNAYGGNGGSANGGPCH
jgi:hypothetical protein